MKANGKSGEDQTQLEELRRYCCGFYICFSFSISYLYRSSDVYVPRDEAFSEMKNLTFNAKTVFLVLKEVLLSAETSMIDQDLGFLYLTMVVYGRSKRQW
ncbi:putative linoleate 13S-lipoxygenase [Helianthus annuus]|uniref:Linoleate 13S-lipoxygenase n=1 Tax=Helianthus annuus TaxID=4232 RepID=A0A9K3N475_HELAN|nr:putative linoleate 13S-lipoxygenase [Helianthus annuus]KAJ0521162.1 putative linoleate 13S-lipoxygenase [Helianthus annuus]KAJ0771162.1 putative linoleate 13S-lipoxygenase [Helianthus annuus]